MKTLTFPALIAAFIVAGGAAFAQTATPATPPKAPAPAATAAPAAKGSGLSAAEKEAISKKCSAEADAKKLHGEERKKFRETCKKAGKA